VLVDEGTTDEGTGGADEPSAVRTESETQSDTGEVPDLYEFLESAPAAADRDLDEAEAGEKDGPAG
jgi:hypothetical protein